MDILHTRLRIYFPFNETPFQCKLKLFLDWKLFKSLSRGLSYSRSPRCLLSYQSFDARRSRPFAISTCQLFGCFRLLLGGALSFPEGSPSRRLVLIGTRTPRPFQTIALFDHLFESKPLKRPFQAIAICVVQKVKRHIKILATCIKGLGL